MMRFMNGVASSISHPTQSGRRHFQGARGAARAWVLSQILADSPKLLVLCKDDKEAELLAADLATFQSHTPLLQHPAAEVLPFELASPQLSVSAYRLHALSTIRSGSPFCLPLSITSLVQKTLPFPQLLTLQLELRPGESLQREHLIQQLAESGYRRVATVEEQGDFAVRGEVIDVFPVTTSAPARISLLDDIVEEIRLFDRETQRSTAVCAELRLPPVREVLPLSRLTPMLPRAIQRLRDRAASLDVPPRELEYVVDVLQRGLSVPGQELMQITALGESMSLFDALPPDTRIVLVDEISIHRSFDTLAEHVADREHRMRVEHRLHPPKEALYLTHEECFEHPLMANAWTIDNLEVFGSTPRPDDEIVHIQALSNADIATRLTTKVGSGKALAPLQQFLAEWRATGNSLAVVVGSENRAHRLQQTLLQYNLDAPIRSGSAQHWVEDRVRAPVAILLGQLSEGFRLPNEGIAFIAEHEIFGERSYRHRRDRGPSMKRLLGTLAQLKEGDFIVHEDEGIGIYRGLKHLEIEGVRGDFLQLDYANESRLYLPIQHIGKIQKYVGSEGEPPVLDRLGSNRWVKTKQKVRESVVTLAGELIKLYATRSVAKGWRFDPAGAEDDRFADTFPFDETPDQLKAIEATLGDLAQPKPMDRLICGDAGFGKTEVALRAAFKCIQHGRQVALLAPTTILVDQHYQTFKSRLSEFPVKVGAVSRFYSKDENHQALAQLASGELDVIVGTHRLLQRDVNFKDLGLVVIDEEHRFGVKHKERLKQMRKDVDVLTLTATPIPRTLHMSLLGIRDISVITTPPHNRQVIRTYVARESDALVKDAVMRELQRRGQVFYLHNRVESIAGVAARLQQLIPNARIDFAHGQMDEDQLEKIMHRFIAQEIDVLVSTTIIESGLDIPNANTIIIERADALGLAQLYQLRGRVGRSNRQAYAYFLVPETGVLGPDAEKRLKVLQSLDELGQGFHLAIHDLEIRGAGNLLGKEQSGSVIAVGYDLYTKILREAIANLKGEEVPLEEEIDTEVKLGLDAFIPEFYIPDISERLILYQRLAALESSEEADALQAEMEDRFGTLHRETRALVEMMRLRALLRTHGVVKAEYRERKLALTFHPKAKLDMAKVVELVKREPKKFRLGKTGTLTMECEFDALSSPHQLYSPCERVLGVIVAMPP